MTKLAYKEDVRELLISMDDSVAVEYERICAVISNILYDIQQPMQPAAIVALVLESVDIKYLPIITYIVADSFEAAVTEVEDQDLLLFHKLVEYTIAVNKEYMKAGVDVPTDSTYSQIVNDSIH